MNRNDFRNPLIKSGAVLVFVILLITAVANSEGHGIIGGISALISGLFSAVVFIIGLCFTIIISIAIIIGLFIAAVSIHSVDKARSLFDQLMASLRIVYDKFSSSASGIANQTLKAAGKVHITPGNAHTAPPLDEKTAARLSLLEHDIKQLEAAIYDLQATSQKTVGQITELQDRLATLQGKDYIRSLKNEVE
jgi:hypothetical protein